MQVSKRLLPKYLNLGMSKGLQQTNRGLRLRTNSGGVSVWPQQKNYGWLVSQCVDIPLRRKSAPPRLSSAWLRLWFSRSGGVHLETIIDLLNIKCVSFHFFVLFVLFIRGFCHCKSWIFISKVRFLFILIYVRKFCSVLDTFRLKEKVNMYTACGVSYSERWNHWNQRNSRYEK